MEADYAAKFGAEELVLPEWRAAVKFESRTETKARFRDGHAGKPFADGLERGRGDDRWAVGDELVGDASGIMANHDGVIQEFAEPFGCRGGVSRERECCDRDGAVVIGNGERNSGEVRVVCGTNQMQGGGGGCG